MKSLLIAGLLAAFGSAAQARRRDSASRLDPNRRDIPHGRKPACGSGDSTQGSDTPGDDIRRNKQAGQPRAPR